MLRAAAAALLCAAVPAARGAEAPEDSKTVKTALCTTFPIYQITRNVARGRAEMDVQLLLPSQLGCPHDYALTPQDMRKLSAASILVVNGLGMEEFLGAPVARANPALTLVDSSTGIADLLPYADGAPRGVGDEHGDDHHAKGHADGRGAKDGAHGHHADADGHRHGHSGGANPHLFASPRMAARLAANIADGLAKADPAGAAIYRENAKAYAARMDALAGEMAALGKRLKNNRVIQPHGVFDYLARDIGLEIIATTQPHGAEPSAAEMLALVKTAREKGAGCVLTEPQYSDKVGRAVAREASIPVAMLDPCATGPDDAPLGHYEDVMRKNMAALEAALGVK